MQVSIEAIGSYAFLLARDWMILHQKAVSSGIWN